MSIKLSILLITLLTLFWRIYRVFEEQNKFERKITEEWNNMTEEEKLASGRENKYC